MANMTSYRSRVQMKNDTTANWAKAVNFVPLKGEIIVYSDVNKLKIGDGSTNVNDLGFVYDPEIQGILDKVGAANGIAGLDENGLVPQTQLPDIILGFNSKDNFPSPGEENKLYIDTTNNEIYRWSEDGYIEISSKLELGTSETTAFRGDLGNVAYAHATNKGSAFTSGLYKITTNDQGHVIAAELVVKSDLTALGLPGQDTTYQVATETSSGLMATADKKKLNGIELGANKTVIDTALSTTSTNPVENKAVQAKFDELIGSTDVASQIAAALTSVRGQANGLAELDENGHVPSAQLPSYVDDVLEFDTKDDFPVIGESGKIYINLEDNKSYRWGGTVYVEIASSLALGETSATAYPGDKGKVAYDHAVSKGNAYSFGLYKITTNDQGHVIQAEAVTKEELVNMGLADDTTIRGLITSNSNSINDLQTAVAGKQNTITGAASSIVTNNLTATRVLVTNGDGKVSAATLSADKLDYLTGVTADIQQQFIDTKEYVDEQLSNFNIEGIVTSVNNITPDSTGNVDLNIMSPDITIATIEGGNRVTVTDSEGTEYFDVTNGITPHIGENKNWFIGEKDTNIIAEGKNGEPGIYFGSEEPVSETHPIWITENDISPALNYASKFTYTNITVSASDFVQDTEENAFTNLGFNYKAFIELNGVLESYIPDITPSLKDIVEGKLAPIAQTVEGGIYIYANDIPTEDIVLLIINLWGGNY